MYNAPRDLDGINAYNAMRDAMADDFIAAGTDKLANVSQWQGIYSAITGHNASPSAYHSALTSAVWMFEAHTRNNRR